MSYALRYLLHGFIWFITYMFVTMCCLVFNSFALYAIGITGAPQTIIAWLGAMLVGAFWGHKLACDLVPMGPDGEHISPPRV